MAWPRPTRLGQAALIGSSYAAIVFAIGTLLGILRVSFIEPRTGARWAVLLELPLILCAAWWVCGQLLRHCQGCFQLWDHWVIGATALLWILACEHVLVWLLVPISSLPAVGERAHAAWIGFAGQLAFAAFPRLYAGRQHSPA